MFLICGFNTSIKNNDYLFYFFKGKHSKFAVGLPFNRQEFFFTISLVKIWPNFNGE